jgi:hypothetical protein
MTAHSFVGKYVMVPNLMSSAILAILSGGERQLGISSNQNHKGGNHNQGDSNVISVIL